MRNQQWKHEREVEESTGGWCRMKLSCCDLRDLHSRNYPCIRGRGMLGGICDYFFLFMREQGVRFWSVAIDS